MNPEILALETEADKLKADGKNEEAIAKLVEALAIDETFVRGHLALSVLYHKTEDHAKSVEHGEKAYQLEPEDPFNAAALSVTYQRAFEGTRDPIYIQKAESVNTNMR
ncbi:MAG: tetratricopeptide repeat protein [Mariniblastus sp.]